jgi:hypothetical protein
MRSSRNILLLVLAICLALAALATPLVLKGLAQKRIERAVRLAGGSVTYQPDVSDPSFKGFVADLIGPQFLGDIVYVDLLGLRDPAVVNQVLDQLGDLAALQMLGLSGDGVDAAGLEKIANLKALDFVGIHGGPLPDVSPLARSGSITSVRLNDMRGVTPELVEQLVRIPHLEEVDLTGTDIAGNSLAGFQDCPHLRWLFLSQTAVTADDLDELKKKLPHVKISP